MDSSQRNNSKDRRERRKSKNVKTKTVFLRVVMFPCYALVSWRSQDDVDQSVEHSFVYCKMTKSERMNEPFFRPFYWFLVRFPSKISRWSWAQPRMASVSRQWCRPATMRQQHSKHWHFQFCATNFRHASLSSPSFVLFRSP